MKPYRTQQEGMDIFFGDRVVRTYDEALALIPDDFIRDLVDRRILPMYKSVYPKHEMDIVWHIRWDETPEGGPYWAKVYNWMWGFNDLPEYPLDRG